MKKLHTMIPWIIQEVQINETPRVRFYTTHFHIWNSERSNCSQNMSFKMIYNDDTFDGMSIAPILSSPFSKAQAKWTKRRVKNGTCGYPGLAQLRTTPMLINIQDTLYLDYQTMLTRPCCDSQRLSNSTHSRVFRLSRGKGPHRSAAPQGCRCLDGHNTPALGRIA